MKNSNSDIRLWYVVAYAILFLSVLRGIRFPNIWSYTHFLFNYDFGFIKRGLIGEIIGQFNNAYLMSYDFFLIFSMTVFSINVVLTSLLLKDLIDSREPVFIGCSLLFSSSLAVVFLSHSVGYFDHIGLLIALITLKTSGFYKKIVFLSVSMPFVLLTHEAVLIIFFPVIFMSLLFGIEAEGRVRKMKKVLILGLFSASSLAIVFFVANHTLEESEARQMYESLQANIRHPLRQDAFDVLHRNSKDNLDIMKNARSGKKNLKKLALSFIITAPVFIVFVCFSTLILKKSKVEFHLTALSVLASLSPLAMHLFGWDIYRWNTLTVTTGFLMLYVVYVSKFKNQPVAISGHVCPIFVFLIFLNGVSSISLFDGFIVKQFPFVEHLKYIADLICGKEMFPDVPLH